MEQGAEFWAERARQAEQAVHELTEQAKAMLEVGGAEEKAAARLHAMERWWELARNARRRINILEGQIAVLTRERRARDRIIYELNDRLAQIQQVLRVNYIEGKNRDRVKVAQEDRNLLRFLVDVLEALHGEIDKLRIKGDQIIREKRARGLLLERIGDKLGVGAPLENREQIAWKIDGIKAEVRKFQAWVRDLQSGMYVNCVYCGHRYGPKGDTPVSMADLLKEHIEQCPKHPASALKADVARLKGLLREATSRKDAKQNHDGDCSIYAACDVPTNPPESGICTCGYGHQQNRKDGAGEHLYSGHFKDQMLFGSTMKPIPRRIKWDAWEVVSLANKAMILGEDLVRLVDRAAQRLVAKGELSLAEDIREELSRSRKSMDRYVKTFTRMNKLRVLDGGTGPTLKWFRLNVLRMGLRRFAEWLGVKPSQVANVEKGRRFDESAKLPTKEKEG